MLKSIFKSILDGGDDLPVDFLLEFRRWSMRKESYTSVYPHSLEIHSPGNLIVLKRDGMQNGHLK